MIIRTFLSAYFLCVGSLFAFAETTKTKPNILFIMADDQSGQPKVNMKLS